MWSSAREPSVAIYPDSDKMGVWAGEDKAMLRRADGHADYRRGNLTSDVTAGTQAGSRPAPGRRPPGTQAGSLPRPRPAMPPGAPVRSVRRRPS
ncbi:MAG: hypothetical protein ACJ780_02660 [Solirubrobacteraceae bacterium]